VGQTFDETRGRRNLKVKSVESKGRQLQEVEDPLRSRRPPLPLQTSGRKVKGVPSRLVLQAAIKKSPCVQKTRREP